MLAVGQRQCSRTVTALCPGLQRSACLLLWQVTWSQVGSHGCSHTHDQCSKSLPWLGM
jgi:hypothetical protein